jgi:hypothetical protein
VPPTTARTRRAHDRRTYVRVACTTGLVTALRRTEGWRLSGRPAVDSHGGTPSRAHEQLNMIMTNCSYARRPSAPPGSAPSRRRGPPCRATPLQKSPQAQRLQAWGRPPASSRASDRRMAPAAGIEATVAVACRRGVCGARATACLTPRRTCGLIGAVGLVSLHRHHLWGRAALSGTREDGTSPRIKCATRRLRMLLYITMIIACANWAAAGRS